MRFCRLFSTFLFICHSQSNKILSKVHIAGVLCLNTLNKLSLACMLLAFQGEKCLRGREREREEKRKKNESLECICNTKILSEKPSLCSS